jgi:hypothetical protein
MMPATARVGDVFRPENVLGSVFEEVAVNAVDRTVAGPRGPVAGAIVTDELHLDGTHEDKTFAPGYGEFRTGSGNDIEAIALAVPIDALGGPVPPALDALSTTATGLVDATAAREWDAARANAERARAAWRTLRGGAPPMIAARIDQDLGALARAVRSRRSARAVGAALNIAQSALDLELRHRPPAEIDVARFDLRARRLVVDAAAEDLAGVRGDVAVLEWMRDRIAHTLGRAARAESTLACVPCAPPPTRATCRRRPTMPPAWWRACATATGRRPWRAGSRARRTRRRSCPARRARARPRR